MGNMIAYVLAYKDKSFTQAAFNEADSLVLSELSYLLFDGHVPEKKQFQMTLHALACLEGDSLYKDTFTPTENKALLAAIRQSVRFSPITAACYINTTDVAAELQFSAVTFRIAKQLYYIAFRGTDISLVGWKEDFNLSFSQNIPAQLCALNYLKKTARRLHGTLLVGGHSKGGNLAVYAAMMAPNRIKRRIQTIYNHDGPGFLPEVFCGKAFRSVRDRIEKTVPQSAIVGLLLEQHEPYSVVASKAFALLQHNPFTWEIDAGAFVRIREVDRFSKFTNKTLNVWINSIDIATRKTFVDALYEILLATNATTYPQLFANWKKGIKPAYTKMKQLDPEVRKRLHKTLRTLLKVSAREMKLLLPTPNASRR